MVTPIPKPVRDEVSDHAREQHTQRKMERQRPAHVPSLGHLLRSRDGSYGLNLASKCKGAYARSIARIASRSGYQGDEVGPYSIGGSLPNGDGGDRRGAYSAQHAPLAA